MQKPTVKALSLKVVKAKYENNIQREPNDYDLETLQQQICLAGDRQGIHRDPRTPSDIRRSRPAGQS